MGQEESFHAITKFSIERSDAVTAVSDFLKEETLRTFGCGGCRIQVIPNFVKLEEYHPAGPAGRDGLCPEGHKLLTHISNFREVKRVRDVVRIFARVRRSIPATLLMIGDGPDRTEAERESRELGVDGDVRFLGRIDTVAPLLQQSDLFLLPSQSESFGLAALEAMACGAPVVGSRVGGLPELIQDGTCGILEPPGSVEAMARRAAELLRDPARHREMKDAATARARLYAADAIVPRYEELYRAVAG